MNSLLDSFTAAFSCKYSTHDRGRWSCFRQIALFLLAQEKPIHIVETGGLRGPGNFDGDGNSTILWDWLSSQTGGTLISLDLHDHCGKHMLEHCPGMISGSSHFVRGDSLEWILTHSHKLSAVSLLYLDSYDYSSAQRGRASLHAAGELALAWDALPSGCLIAIDDCISVDEGKHLLISNFFRLQGIPPVLDTYITAWVKP